MKYSTPDHEQDQETLALLKILALGRRHAEEGRTIPAKLAFRRLLERRRRLQKG